MKKIYFLSAFVLIAFFTHAQTTTNSVGLAGSCINPDEGTIDFIIDLSKNCPEADPEGELAGTPELGFHTGINGWSSGVNWDDPNAVTAINDGNDIFTVSINVFDYYGVQISELEDIQIVLNNGIANPSEPWALMVKDSTDDVAWNNPCSNLMLFIDQTPTCATNTNSIGLAGSCINQEEGTITFTFDLSKNCPEADPEGELAGTPELGFHTGINGWSSGVNWDDPNAVTAVNDGNDIFTASINVLDYYGIELSELVDVQIVLNNGIANPSDPWALMVKDSADDPTWGDPCSNLLLFTDQTPDCDYSGLSSLTFQPNLSVSPNPFQESTIITFENPNNESMDVLITNLTGQTVRMLVGQTGEQVLIEREGLTAGIYFASVWNKKGQSSTVKIMVK